MSNAFHVRVIPAAAFAFLLALSTSVAANGKKDWVCWMQPSGVTQCKSLQRHPDEHYFVSGVTKPHKHEGLKQPCRHCSVDFRLNEDNIDSMSDYTDTTTMRSAHDATLYGSKQRHDQD